MTSSTSTARSGTVAMMRGRPPQRGQARIEPGMLHEDSLRSRARSAGHHCPSGVSIAGAASVSARARNARSTWLSATNLALYHPHESP
jgi:hypothetical protein